MTNYQRTIREVLDATDIVGVDVRHIEAWMRVEHGTLDAMGREQFDLEVVGLVAVVRADPRMSESLARSYGL